MARWEELSQGAGYEVVQLDTREVTVRGGSGAQTEVRGDSGAQTGVRGDSGAQTEVRLVCISDTHSRHEAVEVPDGGWRL